MNTTVNIGNKRLSESDNGYGAGGAFPPLSPHVEGEAIAAIASYLFPGAEDLDQALEGHTVDAVCAAARKIEDAGEVLPDGTYPVAVTVDGKEYRLDVTISW